MGFTFVGSKLVFGFGLVFVFRFGFGFGFGFGFRFPASVSVSVSVSSFRLHQQLYRRHNQREREGVGGKWEARTTGGRGHGGRERCRSFMPEDRRPRGRGRVVSARGGAGAGGEHVCGFGMLSRRLSARHRRQMAWRPGAVPFICAGRPETEWEG
jgi:hypothetical protein